MFPNFPLNVLNSPLNFIKILFQGFSEGGDFPIKLLNYYPLEDENALQVFCRLWGAKVDLNYKESAPAKILKIS